MNRDCSGMIYDVLQDCRLLKRFSQAHMISRSLWDSLPREQRKRFIDQHYVVIEPERVILTVDGLSVLGYREVTA